MRAVKIGVALTGLAFLAACGGSASRIKLDTESDAFYRSARLIMTKQENAIFHHLPDADARKEFIVDFWDKRDTDPETPENEYKMEFESRVQYANKHFIEGGPGFNTDRGRIYIYIGPPELVEEYQVHYDPEVQGSIIHWGYPQYELGIEFVDERGIGQYKIRRYEGRFFQALDNLKLGQYTEYGDVFKKRVVDFDLRYDRDAKEFLITLPADSLTLSDDEGRLRADLNFVVYIYPEKGGKKETTEASRTFLATDNEFIGMKEIPFTVPYDLAPGKYFVDVIIKGKEGSRGKIRKIFEVKTT